MANYQYQPWELTEKNKKSQSPPHGKRHYIVIALWILASLAVLILGLVLVFNPNLRAEDTALAISVVVALIGIIYVFAVLTRTARTTTRLLLLGALFVIGAVVVSAVPQFLTVTFRILIGVLSVVTSVFMLIDVIRLIKEDAPWFSSAFWFVLYLVLGLLILFSGDGTRILAIYVGLYLVALGLNAFLEGIGSLLFHNAKLRHNFTIILPKYIAAFLPMAFFREINMMVEEEPAEVLRLQEPAEGKEPPLIVYVHTRAGLIPGFGHCDLCYKGKVYAYGDYDEATWRLGGFLADGTMALVPPQKHLEMALKDDKKILMAYGLMLTPELEEAVQKKLDEIMSMTYEWKPEAQLAAEGLIDADPNSFKDTGSLLYLEEDATLYKFKEGSKYKTYYGLLENCAEVVNDVIGTTGLRLIQPNGIVTPGTYLYYLDELYEAEDTIVTERRLYMLDENGHPVEYPLKPGKPFRLGDLSN